MTKESVTGNSSGWMNSIGKFAGGKIFPYIAILIIALLCIVIYSNIYDNSTHFDDDFIFKNTDLHNPGDFDKLFSINKFRLIPFWTFAYNYASSNEGKELGGFYAFNVMIHIINSIFVFGITLLIFRTPVLRDTSIARHGPMLAFTAGLLFAVHPLQTQAVTYIYQRLASIAATFYFGAILTYLAGRIVNKGMGVRIILFFLSFVFLILGLFSKENVFTIFPMILIIELMLFNKNFRLSPAVVGVFVGLIVVGIFIFLQFQVPGNVFAPLVNFNGETITSQSYLLTQFKVLPMYFRLFIFPFGQNFDHDIRVSDSFFDGGVLLGFAIIALIIGFGLYMYKYNRLITFGILWTFLTISIESSIIPIADVMFEHRVYLPMLGMILALIGILYEVFSRREKLLPVMFILLFVFAGISGVLANKRNNVWNSELTLWTDAVHKSPQKARTYFKRGQANLTDGKVAWALYDFNQVIRYRPEFISAYTYRSAILESLNKNREALNDHDKFIELSKDKTQGYLNRARAYAKMKVFGKALEDYDAYLKKNNLDSDVYLEKAAIYELLNNSELAIKTSQQALKADTSNPNAMYAHGKYLYMTAKFDEALVWLNKAILSPKIKTGTILRAYNIKGSTLFFKKQYDESLTEFNKAYEISKTYQPLLINMALYYRTTGDYSKELTIIDRVIALEENNTNNWLARGLCNINLKNYKEADKDLRKALMLDRTNKEANFKLAGIQKFLN
ncbi:MAG: hypothetical protein RO257_10805 [Candidatus Kapabacteria bacterium]|nr:hypothetical protein [Candidatus Kapabacteria bacterium]